MDYLFKKVNYTLIFNREKKLLILTFPNFGILCELSQDATRGREMFFKNCKKLFAPKCPQRHDWRVLAISHKTCRGGCSRTPPNVTSRVTARLLPSDEAGPPTTLRSRRECLPASARRPGNRAVAQREFATRAKPRPFPQRARVRSRLRPLLRLYVRRQLRWLLQ